MWIRCSNRNVVHSRHYNGFAVEEFNDRANNRTLYCLVGGYQYRISDRLSELAPNRALADFLLDELYKALSANRSTFDINEATAQFHANNEGGSNGGT